MELISNVYPDLNVKEEVTKQYLEERSILSPRKDDVSVINVSTINLLPGESYEFLAADSIIEKDIEVENRGNRITSDSLNSLDPSSLRSFNLQLKIGCPIMLLCDLQPRDGLAMEHVLWFLMVQQES
ncbi:hypothetical protein AQUCO_00500491v1 [Aquilegia coerulea]|uniref:DNA helicase Pif1-like 2B domain-containing protein n=1 Tax=Aquilegia coerulea TaxID=218851 RepID=A0A2G5ESF4_AQUCA|nr:hypothetical protein AQUCO_00500491v1 [Aquilegia coerulea]